jgi:outer membrane protein assembly factor BamB
LAGGSLLAAEAGWPQWRGPAGTGAAPADAKPPVEWSDTKNIKWKAQLPGEGSGTPIIWGDKIFLQVAVSTGKAAEGAIASPGDAPPAPQPGGLQPGGPRRRPGGPGGRPGGFGGGPGGGMSTGAPNVAYQFAVVCLDRATGKKLWQTTVKEEKPHEGHHRDHGFSSHSGVTDGKVLVGWFGSRGLHCLDLDGKLKWSKDLGKQQTRAGFGEGNAPALHGNTVLVQWDHEGDDFIAAFDKETGKELWRQTREEATSWSTPLIVEHDGKPQVITAATTKIRSYDLATGAVVWELGGLTANVIPTPVAADGMVYITSGFRGAALFAIRLGRTGNLAGTDAVVWEVKKSTPYVPSPLLAGGRIYVFSGNNAILSVYDAKTGKPVLDTQRVDGLQTIYSSPVAAAGHVYITDRNGQTQVIKADGDKLDVVATNQLPDAPFNASAAVVGNELYLRGKTTLYCIAAP